MASIASESRSPCLPPEPLLIIAGYLDAVDLARMAQVCRVWRAAATRPLLWNLVHLPQRFPWLRIIGRDEVQASLKFEVLQWKYPDIPTTPNLELIETCKRVYPLINRGTKFLVFEIPTHQDRSFITVNQVRDLEDAVKEEHALQQGPEMLPPKCSMHPNCNAILIQLGDHPIPPGHYIMSSGILPGTLHQTRERHEGCNAEYGCPLPGLGPLTFGIFFANITLPLLSAPLYKTVYTRAQEQTPYEPNLPCDTIVGYHDPHQGLMVMPWNQIGGANLGVSICKYVGSHTN